MVFSVGVRDHIMVAHSLKRDTFGPAQVLYIYMFVLSVCLFVCLLTKLQGMHGATYVVDAEFSEVDDENKG